MFVAVVLKANVPFVWPWTESSFKAELSGWHRLIFGVIAHFDAVHSDDGPRALERDSMVFHWPDPLSGYANAFEIE